MNEDRKIRVAITQGDANGIGFELIFKAFLEPEMLELCTPIIYGSPKVASYHNKALNLHNQFSIISKVEDVRDNRVNLLVCTDDDIRVEFGKHSEEATLVEMKAIQKAVGDCQQGKADVLVCGPTDNNTVVFEGQEVGMSNLVWHTIDPEGHSLCLLQTNALRITSVHARVIKDVMSSINGETISAKIKALDSTLRRDYRYDSPRIAVLALNLNDSSVEETILAPVVQTLAMEHKQVFGPYRSDRFFASEDYRAFDAVLAMHYEQAQLPLRMLTDEESVVVQTNLPFVCTHVHCGANVQIAGRGRADENLLRQAIYAATDMFRARQNYDAARANPLPKMYKERSDSGEKQ